MSGHIFPMRRHVAINEWPQRAHAPGCVRARLDRIDRCARPVEAAI
jgi:hypothetical protein